MDIALSLVMLTVIALVLGAVALLRRGGHGRQAALMLALAAIMAINLAIWVLPTHNGTSLSREAQKEQAPK